MYIDEFIFINFIIDYIILNTYISILKINCSKRKIILSCLIGELSVISLFISMSNFIFILFKMIISIFMIVTISYNDFKTLIKNIIYFYIISFFLGGFLFYLKNESIINYKIVLLLVPLIMNIYKYLSYNLKNILTLKYKVTIYLNNGKILYLNGLMDTGNTLVEPYHNRKVIIINKKIDENFYLVPFNTIDSSSLIKCFNPKKVYIDGLGERNDISVGIIDKKFIGFNCLLNYKIMEDL